MLVLSLKQPWASALVHGFKRFETRSRTVRLRGWFLVHASGGTLPREGRRLYESDHAEPLRHWLGIEPGLVTCGPTGSLPTRAIIGAARLDDSRPVEAWLSDAAITFNEAAWGDYSQGRHAYRIGDHLSISRPIPAPGRLGWWMPGPGILRDFSARLAEFKIIDRKILDIIAAIDRTERAERPVLGG